MQIERRVCMHGVELRADAEQRTVTGYAAVFYDGKPDTEFRWGSDYVERIAPGAFKRAVSEDDVRALFNHDANIVLGRNKAGTLRLSEDVRGLRFEVDIPKSAHGDAVLESIRRGDVSGCSFSFSCDGEQFTTDGDTTVRTITSIKTLFDVGPVTFPAYAGTEAHARSMAQAMERRTANGSTAKAKNRQRVMCDARIREIQHAD